MTFTIYHKTVQISDKVCDLYKQFVGMPLTDTNAKILTDFYLKEFKISSNDITAEQLEIVITEQMCDEICANMGESIENAKAFLEQKGFL